MQAKLCWNSLAGTKSTETLLNFKNYYDVVGDIIETILSSCLAASNGIETKPVASKKLLAESPGSRRPSKLYLNL